MPKTVNEILSHLEKSLDGHILDYKIAPLTAVGENFGSKMMSLEIKVKLNNNNRSNKVKEKSITIIIRIKLVFRRDKSNCKLFVH